MSGSQIKIEVITIEDRYAVKLTFRLPGAKVSEELLHNFRYECIKDADSFIQNFKKTERFKNSDTAGILNGCIHYKQYWAFIKSDDPKNIGSTGEIINVSNLELANVA